MLDPDCRRCWQKPSAAGCGEMCTSCFRELLALRQGDEVEWHHHSGSWRPATFLKHIRSSGTCLLRTPVGCEIYRKQILIRVPGGRVINPRRSDK